MEVKDNAQTWRWTIVRNEIIGFFRHTHCRYTVVQRPPEKAPENAENESRKLHIEYTQGNVLTYFFIIM